MGHDDVVVRGRLNDPRHIELEEPVNDLKGEVEVTVRAVPVPPDSSEGDVFDFIAHLPPGTRSKDDIDRQVREERDSWGDR